MHQRAQRYVWVLEQFGSQSRGAHGCQILDELCGETGTRVRGLLAIFVTAVIVAMS
jgi:hypothetical protein